MATGSGTTTTTTNPYAVTSGSGSSSGSGTLTYSNGTDFIGPDGFTGYPLPKDPNYFLWQAVFTPDQVRASRYYNGDQDAPYDWDPNDASEIQRLLYQTGFYGNDKPGATWGPDDSDAYQVALAYANRYGVDVKMMLQKMLASGSRANSGSGGGGLGPAPMTDEDVKALGNKVAQGVLGRVLTEQETANFIPAFRGATAGGINKDGVTSPGVAAENTVRGSNPAEAYAHDAGNVMQTISKLLGG